MEIWISIENTNYQISNCGNIRNSKTMKLLKPQLSSNGYYNITISKKGKRYTPTIHSLVAFYFLGNPKPTVNHKDGNKLNNHIDNLEYVTYSQNMLHAYKINFRPKIFKSNKKNTSGKIGVVFDKTKNRWIARLHKNRKCIHLGTFKNKEDAIKKRIEAENNIDEYK